MSPKVLCSKIGSEIDVFTQLNLTINWTAALCPLYYAQLTDVAMKAFDFIFSLSMKGFCATLTQCSIDRLEFENLKRNSEKYFLWPLKVSKYAAQTEFEILFSPNSTERHTQGGNVHSKSSKALRETKKILKNEINHYYSQLLCLKGFLSQQFSTFLGTHFWHLNWPDCSTLWLTTLSCLLNPI